MDFPRTVNELTPEWLTQVLRESGAIGDEQVVAVSVGDMGGEQGRMTDVRRIEIEYDSASEMSPRTLIIKSKRSDLAAEWTDFSYPMYAREVWFYLDPDPDFNVRLPKCHFAEFDPETGALAIVLEDLGYLRIEREKDDLSLDDGLSAMRYLANLHASWWGKPDALNYGWLAEEPWLWKNADTEVMYQQNFNKWLEYFDNYLPHGIDRISRALEGRVAAIGEALAKPPVTLVHADFKLANMFFDGRADGPSEIVAFDWQMAARLRGPMDIGMFIMQSFEVETRRSVERQLLNEYYDTLIDNGVRGYSKDEFEWDARLAVIPRFVISTASFSLFERNTIKAPEGNAKHSNFMTKLQTLIDWNCEEVIPK
ncbi:DUF1679 domain-containing protein [Dehalococcoides mccartyi]|nr:DUF1679 domain-containing protein [Dehalococcoides mccartyi]